RRLQGHYRVETRRLSAIIRRAAARGNPRPGLRGQLHAGERLRAACSVAAAGGAGHSLRDACGPAGAGRFRALLVSLGRAVRLARRDRLLPVAVVPVLRTPGHADADRWTRVRLSLFRRRPPGAALRSDESGYHARPAAAGLARSSAISS